MSSPSFGAPKPKMSGKKKVLLYGGGAIAGIAGIMYYRSRSAASSATTASTDTSGTDPGIDPTTGIPYADETGDMSGAYGTTPGALGTYDPLTGQYIPGLGTTTPPVTIATNAEWAQAALVQLIANGYDPATATTAIGLYLAGQALTQNQYDIVTAAIGLEGQPPSGAPSPHLAGGGGAGQTNPPLPPRSPVPPGSPVPTSGNVTVPNLINSRGSVAKLALIGRGLKPKQSPAKTPVGKGTTVTSQSPGSGTKVKVGSTVSYNVKVK